MTLDEAVRRALEVQPAMVQAEATRANAQAEVRAARGSFLPGVTATGGASKRLSPSGSDFGYSTTYGASVDLFDGFRRVARNRAASAGARAAAAGLRNQEYGTTLVTKQIFYDAAASAELVRVAASQLTRARQQYQVSVGKLRVGSATRSDSLRSVVEVGNARIALLQAQANLASAEAELGRQIGSDEPVGARVDALIPAPPDTAGLRPAAAESAPSVEQAEAERDAARASVTSARSRYYPGLGLSFGSSRSAGSPWSSLGATRTNTLSFGLSWTLFDGFEREAGQVQARRAEEVAVARADETRRALNADLTRQLATLMTTHAQIGIAEDNVAAATEDFRVQNERYRVGASTIVDLSTSQASLTQAEVNLVQARFNYLIARAGLEAMTGRPLR